MVPSAHRSVSQSVQPFFERDQQAETDHATRSVVIAISAMQRNSNLIYSIQYIKPNLSVGVCFFVISFAGAVAKYCHHHHHHHFGLLLLVDMRNLIYMSRQYKPTYNEKYAKT